MLRVVACLKTKQNYLSETELTKNMFSSSSLDITIQEAKVADKEDAAHGCDDGNNTDT